ncbi:MAG: lysophospholipid acyltransferase family protein [Actinomycetota bacterium]|nr:1-acyl-sn-glycerol-3-phosphate acyltransferase [Actinomycetota bacterium]
MAEPVYKIVIAAARTLGAVKGWKVVTSGADNIPAKGPAILAINHAGYLDFVFAAWTATIERDRLVRYMAKTEVFAHKVSGPLMRAMKHIPVDRKGDPARSLDLAIKALEAGETIGTFPEATINPSFVPGRGKTGTVRMAQATGSPVIPVAVWGAHRLMTKGRPRNFQRGVQILVKIGEPERIAVTDDPRHATDRLMASIRTLLSEAQRDYPQKPANDLDRWWLPAHLGGTAPRPQDVVVREDGIGFS